MPPVTVVEPWKVLAPVSVNEPVEPGTPMLIEPARPLPPSLIWPAKVVDRLSVLPTPRVTPLPMNAVEVLLAEASELIVWLAPALNLPDVPTVT